jgi:hypothetical protein
MCTKIDHDCVSSANPDIGRMKVAMYRAYEHFFGQRCTATEHLAELVEVQRRSKFSGARKAFLIQLSSSWELLYKSCCESHRFFFTVSMPA